MAELGWTQPGFFFDDDGTIILEHCVTRYHAYDVRTSPILLLCLQYVQLPEPYRSFTWVFLCPDARH